MTPEELQRTAQGGGTAKSIARGVFNKSAQLGAMAGASYLSPYIGMFANAASDQMSNWTGTESALLTAADALGEGQGISLMTSFAITAPHLAWLTAAAVGGAVLAGGAWVLSSSDQTKGVTESGASWVGSVANYFKGDPENRFAAAKDAKIEYEKKAGTVQRELSSLGISVMFPAEVHASDKLRDYLAECRGGNYFNENRQDEKSVKEEEFRAAFHNMAYVLTIYQIVQKGDLLWSIIQGGDPCQEAESIFNQMYEITCQLVVDTKTDAPSFGHMLV